MDTFGEEWAHGGECHGWLVGGRWLLVQFLWRRDFASWLDEVTAASCTRRDDVGFRAVGLGE